MPVLQDPRQERFAQLVANGRTNKDAYMEAGYNVTPQSATAQGSKMRRKPAVAERIAELMNEYAVASEERRKAWAEGGELMADFDPRKVDKDYLLREAAMNLSMARDAHNIVAANKALELMGRLAGVFGKDSGDDDSSAKNVDPQRTIAVQIVNQINRDSVDGPGASPDKGKALVSDDAPSAEARIPALEHQPGEPVSVLDAVFDDSDERV